MFRYFKTHNQLLDGIEKLYYCRHIYFQIRMPFASPSLSWECAGFLLILLTLLSKILSIKHSPLHNGMSSIWFARQLFIGNFRRHSGALGNARQRWARPRVLRGNDRWLGRMLLPTIQLIFAVAHCYGGLRGRVIRALFACRVTAHKLVQLYKVRMRPLPAPSAFEIQPKSACLLLHTCPKWIT